MSVQRLSFVQVGPGALLASAMCARRSFRGEKVSGIQAQGSMSPPHAHRVESEAMAGLG